MQRQYTKVCFRKWDIRRAEVALLVPCVDAIIHCAAQTSHPRSIDISHEDATINIQGTLTLLEALRSSGRCDVPFVFCFSNKVYGDTPNELPYVERETRYQLVGLPEVFSPLRFGAFPEFDHDPDETTWNVMGVARAV